MKGDESVFAAFMYGFFIATLSFVALIYFSPVNSEHFADKIRACEKTIPREQSCEIIARPRIYRIVP